MTEIEDESRLSVAVSAVQKVTPEPQDTLDQSRSLLDESSTLDVSYTEPIEKCKTPLSPRSEEVEQPADDEQSNSTLTNYSDYTLQWDEYTTPRNRKSILISQLTHRSKESGRLSPAMETASIEIGTQPLTLPRFNEPLRLKKGRQFVDFEAPAPTVVYVPHRSFAHGRWSNVNVQRRSDGRYVVIEQRPIHTQFTEGSHKKKDIYGRDLFGDSDTSWTKKKAPWRWSSKGDYIERAVNKGFYEPYLPPIKSRYNNVDSKVGSMDNYFHKPGGGTHKIANFKLNWKAEAKVGSLPDKDTNNMGSMSVPPLRLPSISPGYGASADSGSFASVHYTPGGSVILRRPKYDNAKSRIGSLDNVSHEAMGGDVEIPKNKLKWKKESKIGSLDNVYHLPKNSNVQIFDQKLDWSNAESKIKSLDNAEHRPYKKRFKVPSFQTNWNKSARSKVGSLHNANHRPGGGNIQIIDQKLNWKAKPKISSRWKMNFDYQSLFQDEDERSELESQFMGTHTNRNISEAYFPFTV